MSTRPQTFNNLSSEQLLLINILNDMYNENIRQINNYHDAITNLNEANNNIRATLIQMLNVNGVRRTAQNTNIPMSTYLGEFSIPITTLSRNNANANANGRNNSRFLENFFSPVEVYPTQSQIEAATRRVRYCDIVSPLNRSCPISLEQFEDNDMVSVIRQCNHIFRTEELNTWFRSNCRCPVCRYDIRNYSTNAATNSYFQDASGSNLRTNANTNSNLLLPRRNEESPQERMITNVLQSFLNDAPLTDASGNNLSFSSNLDTIGLFRLLFNNTY